MGFYRIFDGINWVDPCVCNVHVRGVAGWQLIDPFNCPVNYWDGKNWCSISCKKPILKYCSVYSQVIDFGIEGGYNSIQYMSGGLQIGACYNIGGLTSIDELVNMFNTPPPVPLPDYCPDPAFCLCWTKYGTYYDNGDGRIRLDIPLAILVRLGYRCEGLSMQVIRD